jgi:hypothetical protein
MQIVPNPIRVSQEFMVVIPDSDYAVVQVYSMTGSFVLSRAIRHETKVKMPGIRNPGTYIVRVLCQEYQIKSEKLIVVE